ncbi:MAG: ATP-binding protein [Oscillospiraceae bacterium]|jgi:AAA+ ATPase superfamily predicted ATPase|nr:ATP-binding protein [Oscillospiraceae bacterium]
MKIIGRGKEKLILKQCVESVMPEFLVVYGRRRIGKTFLIREFFEGKLDFYVTGLASEQKDDQLQAWNNAIRDSFGTSGGNAENWIDAFALLKNKLEKTKKSKKKIIFIDEAPWLDTPKSGFMIALEHFWNGWASGRSDIFLIICGSATSWIINKLFKNKGGLHNRVTRRIRLLPFTLKETETYLKERELDLGRYRICEVYMIFGGVPYYLSLLGKGLSIPQNVDALCFDDNGFLRGEFDEIYSTLFKNSDKYIKVVTALSSKLKGLTRDEIIFDTGLKSGGGITKILDELEICGFIKAYPNYSMDDNLCLYQLTDPFSLFHLRFIKRKRPKNPRFWTSNIESPSLSVWKGYSFERICLSHSEQLKQALGIAAISTEISSWRSRKSSPGAQIDLLFDRKDGIINLIEIKYSKSEYLISAKDEVNLRNKIAVFEAETRTKKAVHLTMMTTYGIVSNSHSGIVNSEITLDALFQ